MTYETRPLRRPELPEIAFCKEKHRLTETFLSAIRELLTLQSQQSQAVIDGDPDFERFELLLHIASGQKELAKYALMAHMDSHHC
jgi:hypothetical protein